MNKFYFTQEQKVRITIEHQFSVSAETYKEAEDYIRTNRLADSIDWHFNDGGPVELLESNESLESQQGITVEENHGQPTIKIYQDYPIIISDNCNDRLYHAQSNRWKDPAKALITKAFPDCPKEKMKLFVEEYWDSSGSDKHNLFNFEKWLYGGSPTQETNDPRLWAYIYHMDVLPRDASDAQIVAFHEHANNWERDYPLEALTPDEFACRVNDEQFNDQEWYVRFITFKN